MTSKEAWYQQLYRSQMNQFGYVTLRAVNPADGGNQDGTDISQQFQNCITDNVAPHLYLAGWSRFQFDQLAHDLIKDNISQYNGKEAKGFATLSHLSTIANFEIKQAQAANIKCVANYGDSSWSTNQTITDYWQLIPANFQQQASDQSVTHPDCNAAQCYEIYISSSSPFHQDLTN